VTRDLGLDPAKGQSQRRAVALGHPIGATGCILTVKAIYELHRTGKRYALVTMCIGGGQGSRRFRANMNGDSRPPGRASELIPMARRPR